MGHMSPDKRSEYRRRPAGRVQPGHYIVPASRAPALVAGVVALAIAQAACAAPRPPDRTLQFQSTAHSARLGNGVRVMVVEDHATNLVQLAIRLDVGSSSDPAGMSGLAHLVEHLMFQVTGSATGSPVGAQLSAVAIRFNALTSWEATLFEALAPADQLARLLEIEGRRFAARCADIDPGTFERERAVVRNELLLRGGSGGTDIDLLMEQIYPRGHPYARPTGGDQLELSRLTLDDACAFIAASYRPDRMVVVVSGDIEPRGAIGLVARHLGNLRPRSAAPRPLPVYPTLTATAMRRTTRDAVAGLGPAVVVAWPLPPTYSPDRTAAAIATSLFAAELERELGMGAAVVELGETRAPVAAAIIRLGRDARRDPRAVDETLFAVQRAVARASSEQTARELDPLFRGRARKLLGELDDMSSRVRYLSAALQSGAPDQVFVAELGRLDQLGPRDVRRAAGTLFARRLATILIVDPGERTPRGSRPATLSYASASHDDSWAAPVAAREATLPLRARVPRSALAGAERLRLANGLDVILLRTGAAPLVRAQLLFAGGSADDPRGQEGLAFLAAQALDFGAIGAADSAASDLLSRFGLQLEVRVDPDQTAFATTGLSTHVDAVLARLASLVEDGQYSDDMLDQVRGVARAQAAGAKLGAGLFGRRWLDRSVHLRRSLYRAAYGESHPYARAEAMLLAAEGRIVRADLERVRTRRFGARNGVLIVTGQFDPSLARAHVERAFAQLRSGAPHVIARPPPAPRSSPALVVLPGDPADATVRIQIAYATLRDPRRRAARMVVARILQERVARVREVLGAAYSASAIYEDAAGPGIFVITVAVDAARTDEALATIMAELARLRAGAPADVAESFVRARRAVLNEVVGEPSGAVAAAAQIAALVARGEGLEGQARFASQVMALTLEDLQLVLELDLVPSRETIGLLGPLHPIATARAATGL